MVTFVRYPGNRVPAQFPLSNGLKYPSKGGRISQLSRVARFIVIPPKSQRWVDTLTERNGLVVLEPSVRVHDKHGISVAEGMLLVKTNVPFPGLVANFGDISKQLTRNQ